MESFAVIVGRKDNEGETLREVYDFTLMPDYVRYMSLGNWILSAITKIDTVAVADFDSLESAQAWEPPAGAYERVRP